MGRQESSRLHRGVNTHDQGLPAVDHPPTPGDFSGDVHTAAQPCRLRGSPRWCTVPFAGAEPDAWDVLPGRGQGRFRAMGLGAEKEQRDLLPETDSVTTGRKDR